MTNFTDIIHPDLRTQFLLRAKADIEEAVEASKAKGTKQRLHLFLEWHYPFFDKRVQSILMERHPEKSPEFNCIPCHAIHAFFWAEQGVWFAYGPATLADVRVVTAIISPYFLHDLKWFLRLQTAIAENVENILNIRDEYATHEMKLQAWRNVCADRDLHPSVWLDGTPFLRKKKQQKEDRPGQNPMKSVRVSATKINKERRELFQKWLPCWEDELQLLTKLLQISSEVDPIL